MKRSLGCGQYSVFVIQMNGDTGVFQQSINLYMYVLHIFLYVCPFIRKNILKRINPQ